MKTTVNISVILLVVCGAMAASYKPARDYWKKRNRPNWRLAGVKKPARMEGAVAHKQGLGPFLMEGVVVGTDALREGEEGPETQVLRDVKLTGDV